jgi:hypothetical protein
MDIVERLRLFAKDDASTAIIADNAFKRADEIERLREENNDLKSALMNVLFSEVSHVEITEFTKEKE